MTLQRFLEEFGIASYEGLVSRCAAIGVVPPTEEEFFKARGDRLPSASCPTEGIVVVSIEPMSPESAPDSLVPVADDVVTNSVSVEETVKSFNDKIVSAKRKKKGSNVEVVDLSEGSGSEGPN